MTKEKTVELASLQIISPQQFGQLLDLVHDEFFDLDEIQYHSEQDMVEIPFRRIFHNGPARTIRNWLFYAVMEVDVIRARMRVHNVDEYEVHDRARMGTYSFNTARYNQDTSLLIFQCEPNLELRMKVSKFLIDCEDLEVRGKSRVSYLFGVMDWSSGKVYE